MKRLSEYIHFVHSQHETGHHKIPLKIPHRASAVPQIFTSTENYKNKNNFLGKITLQNCYYIHPSINL